jgi:hypothetical protein
MVDALVQRAINRLVSDPALCYQLGQFWIGTDEPKLTVQQGVELRFASHNSLLV